MKIIINNGIIITPLKFIRWKGLAMRKSRFTKIITVILAMVLLACSAVAVSAFAEETNEDYRVTVVSKNVCYDARMELVFALTCDGLAENEEVYLLFWENAPDLTKSASELYASALYRKTAASVGETVQEVTDCMIFESEGIAASKLNDDLYVLPVIKAVDTTGDEVAYTYEIGAELLTYSVKSYAEEKLAEDYLPDVQYRLYNNLLAYAQAADAKFDAPVVEEEEPEVPEEEPVVPVSGELPEEGGENTEELPEGEPEDDPELEVLPRTVSVAFKNVAYGGAIQLVYYVESANLVEGDVLKLVIDGVECDSFGKATVGETEYDGFVTGEIDFKQLRKAVSATPIVVDAEGVIIAEFATVEYSVFDYCMDRFEKEPTDAQSALYLSLLNFGASVQEVLEYTDETVAELGGWINAYYGVKVNRVVDGEIVGYDKYYYTANETGKAYTVNTIKYLDANGEMSRFSSAEFETKAQKGSVAGTGITFTALADLGFTNVYCNYSGGGAFVTFEGATELPANIAAKEFKKDDTTTSGTWECLRTETLEDGRTNSFFHIEKKGSNSSNSVKIYANSADTDTVRSIDMSFRASGVQAVADTTLFIKFIDSKGTIIKSGANADYAYTFNSDSNGTQIGAFKVGEWYDVTLELVKAEDGKSWVCHLYISGSLSQTLTVGSADVAGIHFEPRFKYDVSLDIDNMFTSAK